MSRRRPTSRRRIRSHAATRALALLASAALVATACGANAAPPATTWRVFSATFEASDAASGGRAASAFAPGRRGRALRVGPPASPAELALPRVVDLARPGAITLWIRPQGWRAPNPSSDYVPVLRITGVGPAALVVERDRRHVGRTTDVWIAGFFSLSSRGEIQHQSELPSFWSGDAWHFVAFQWDGTGFSLKLDDGPAARIALPDAALMRDFPKDSSTLLVGSGGLEGFLVDDLSVWSRPLTSSELDALRRQ